MGQRHVAILGTRYQDFSIEEEVFTPRGVGIVAGPGGSPDEIVDVAGDAEVVLAGSGPAFNTDVLRRLSCRGIVRYGIGTDTIDLEAARQLGMAVARVSDYGTEAVAFHALAMATALLRHLPQADRLVRAGGWGVADLRPLDLPSTVTAGVIGYGRIGRQVAQYLQCLGMTVCAYDEYTAVPTDDGVLEVSLDELLERSDVVTLHAPGDPQGRPLLDASRLARMKLGSIVVNTARGSLIDVDALVAALPTGRPALAALDVFPDEPVDAAMFEDVADRVLLSPHMAWYTEQSEADMRRKAAAEAARLLDGEPLVDAVVEPGEQQ